MKQSALQNKSMPQKRVIILRRWSNGIAAMLLVGVTVSFINSAYSVPAPVQAVPYDGITLYRGLFFASGPVAGKIPSIRKVAPYFPSEYKSLESQITKYIQTKDPDYFNRFAREIQSGDRVRVAAAIRDTNKLQKEALLEVTKNSKAPFALQVQRLRNSAEPSLEPGVITDFATCIILFVHIVMENILVAPKSLAGDLKGLSFERYVDEIVSAVPKTSGRPPSRSGKDVKVPQP